MNKVVKCQADKHFERLKIILNKSEAFHEMVGYIDALYQLGFINFKERIIWGTELRIWFEGEEVKE